MRMPVIIVCGILLLGFCESVTGEEIQWRPAQGVKSKTEPSSPLFRLGRPFAIPAENVEKTSQTSVSPIQPVSYQQSTGPIIRAQGVDSGVPNVPPPSVPGAPFNPDENYNCGVDFAPGTAGTGTGSTTGGIFSSVPGFFSGIVNPTGGRKRFESDHCFDTFSSPVTNSFLFEDPRSLTEVRPIFIYQTTPSGNPVYQGGHVEYIGLQARLAFNDYFSLVFHKLGWTFNNPNNPTTDIPSGNGFSELHLGPKVTFLRNDETQTLMAAGLIFQVPVGSSSAVQNTGSLSLVPYLSFGQQFGESSYGRFHFLNTTGYSFRTDGERSEYFYTSLHLDYDVAKLNKIFPFVELNYFLYTRDGSVRAQDFEGRALINFGANSVSGENDLSIATGLRYKFSEMFQIGAGAEWALLSNRDIMDFRLTIDLIFRY